MTRSAVKPVVKVEVIPQVQRFLDGLDAEDRTRVNELFSTLERLGRLDDHTKFHRMYLPPHSFWSIKAYQIRLMGDYRPGGRFVVAHGCIKKANEHRSKDIETVIARLRGIK